MKNITNIDNKRLFSKAKKGDPLAMLELATRYDSGLIASTTGHEFPFWLKRFFETDIIANILNDLDDEDNIHLPIRDYYKAGLYIPAIIDAGIMLGLYYMESGLLEEVEIAQRAFYNAYLASKFDCLEVTIGDCKIDIVSLLTKTQDRIESINPTVSDQSITEITEKIVSIFGKDAWDKLHKETQTDIITSELCFYKFNSYEDELDYSSSIMPIMRGLEREIRETLLKPYQFFLINNYTTDEYVSYNFPNYNKPQLIDSIKKRSLIISYQKETKEYEYVKPDYECTIGAFCYSICSLKKRRIIIDPTFIDFSKNVYFNNPNLPTEAVGRWIGEIIQDLRSIQYIRNESAHAGRIMNAGDAKNAINVLVEVEKALAKIVVPSLSGIDV